MSSYQSIGKYLLAKYARRMAMAKERLGDRCAVCGATEELELHHKNPKEKSFTVTTGYGKPLNVFLEEVDKCELLCCDHHVDKHRNKEHGTLTMYRYCKCEKCREAKRNYMKNYVRPKR